MREFFFGTAAVIGWFAASLIFAFCATWVWLIVREVGGIRGAALATMFTCLAIICTCFGLILSKQETIPTFLLGATVTAAFPPIVFAAIVLSDLYASDRNSHRSFTARGFAWYKRMTQDPGEESNPRHPFRAKEV